MSKIKLNGLEYELWFGTKAMRELEKVFNKSISKIAEEFEDMSTNTIMEMLRAGLMWKHTFTIDQLTDETDRARYRFLDIVQIVTEAFGEGMSRKDTEKSEITEGEKKT